MYMNEVQLLENKEMRETYMERLDVLDQVGNLLLLDELGMATTEMVANYYDEAIDTIKKCTERHSDEVESDGYKVWKKSEFETKLLGDTMSLKTKRGGFDILNNEGEVIASGSNKGVALFPKRAILRIGMLLRDSDIAKELRTQLLNIVEKTSDETKTMEIDKEKELCLLKAIQNELLQLMNI